MGWAFAFKATHERAWHYLKAIDPDIALLQEVAKNIPAWVRHDPGWTIHAPYSRWGSMIVAKAPIALEPFAGPLRGALETTGYLASATAKLATGQTLFLASVHTPIGKATVEELGGFDPEVIRRPRDVEAKGTTGPRRNDVAYAILRQRVVGKRFLVSGDWNVARLWDYQIRAVPSYEVDFFDRAERDGWVECYRRFHPEGEGQTWFRGSDPPYQADHAFCDGRTAEALTACSIHRSPAEDLRLSDHAPLLLELDENRL